jgi:hypothetical protein
MPEIYKAKLSSMKTAGVCGTDLNSRVDIKISEYRA